MELPYADDTVYLAYSQPYTYTKIIAHMFDIESLVSELPGKEPAPNNEDQSTAFFSKRIVKNSITYDR